VTSLGRRRTLAVFASLLVAACSRSAPDATPEGAVRTWIEKMETSADDGRAMREAYLLMGPRARANLKDRAERASRGQGKRYEPHEMLAEAHFGLKFRPKSMTARIEGDEAFVEVRGEGPEEKATVHCTREEGSWRVEPELPEVTQPTRRPDGGP